VVSAPARALLETTRRSLEMALAECKVGKRLGDLGAAVQRCAQRAGFSVVTDFTGHGIGTAMHEAPEVPNFGRPGMVLRLRAGMVLAIEPMLNLGDPGVLVKTTNGRWSPPTAAFGARRTYRRDHRRWPASANRLVFPGPPQPFS
jgi:methionine aminopeptidase